MPTSRSAGHPGEYVLDAWWHDERALRTHYRTPEYADYAQRIGELLARPSDVTIHEIERSYRPAGDHVAGPEPARLTAELHEGLAAWWPPTAA